MVFPGRFSTGCLRCRQRKVKCDEGKPSCKRCERYGKECPGYTDQFHFRHTGTSSFATPATGPPNPKPRKQSSSSSRPSLETPSPKENESEVFSDEPVSRQDDSVASTPPSALGIQVLHPSHEQASLCYFISRFVSPNGSDSFPGHLTFLPSLFDHHHQGVLETATLSVASMAAYNQFGGEKFKVQSYREHGRTIRMIQDMLQAEDQATDDKVIASVLLLCTLKASMDISGERPDHDNEHAPGLFYLLEKRGLEQLMTSRGTEMLLLALLRLQIYSFMRDDDIYSDPGGIVNMLAPYNPLFRALSIMSQSLSLRKRLLQCLAVMSNISTVELDAKVADADSAFSQSRETLQACFEKLEEFDEWDREAASYWHCAFETRAAPTGLGQMSANMSFYDAETACIIVLLRSARLTLLVSMLQYHDRIMPADIGEPTTLLGDRTAWADCVAVLTQDVVKTIDDILAAVPYAFGDVDPSGFPTVMPHDGAAAIVILHSIRLLTYCTYATPEQVFAARSILSRMNDHMGIRSAVDVAEVELHTWKLSWETSMPSPPTSNPPAKDLFSSSPQQTSVSIDGTDYGAWEFMNVV